MAGKYEPARSLAETQLQLQFAVLGGLDAQALGILGVDVALAAIAIAAKSVLERMWWLTLLGLAASAIACFVALIGSEDRVGPKIETTLTQATGGDEDAANKYVAEELSRSISVNEPHIEKEGRAIAFAILSLVVAMILAFVSAVIVS
jgi:apolipoprotein N-acyltransferase